MARRGGGPGQSRNPLIVQRRPLPEPLANIDTKNQSRQAQVAQFSGGALSQNSAANEDEENGTRSALGSSALETLLKFTQRNGDISDLLDPGVVSSIGVNAVREYRIDLGSIAQWREDAERAIAIAAQETDEDGDAKNYPFEDASDINFPLLTTAAQQWAARAGPELVKGDQVVGVKAFDMPTPKGSPAQTAQLSPKPQAPPPQQQAQAATVLAGASQGAVDPSSPGVQVAQAQTDQASQAQAQAQQMAQQAQAEQQALNDQELQMQARESRAQRVKTFLNFCIFYRMEAWEDDTDQLLTDLPILGCGFKKTYVSASGLQSEYVSPMHFTVHRDTKSLNKCPRMTQDYEIYPNEIDEGRRTGRFREDVVLPHVGSDPDEPRVFIEQHRLEDLDGDGLREPYIVTVDEQTMTVMRIEPAFTADGVKINERRVITRIERWNAYSAFKFMPHPRGWFYGIGFGKLLQPISDSIDSSINQLIDAGNAAIAGGGFIGSQVRIQGSAAGGALFMQPGEYQVVATSGPDLRSAIYERTTPNPSDVTFKMLEMLIGAGKDIASVKDVASGDTPTTAPVGTTLAVMNQALQGFSAIWARVYRGFAQEFANMYDCVKRFADDDMRRLYAEVTGGDLDQDFAGDGTDIRPVADPRTVTKMQKVAKAQGLAQVAESPVGQAAGMTQPGPAQEIVREMLDVLDIDRPERFFASAPPNPVMMAKAQSDAAAAQLKQAQAQAAQSSAQLSQAKTVREMGLAAIDSHDLAKEGDRINRTGQVMDTPDEPDAAQMQGAGPGSEMPPPSSAP